MIVFIDYMYEYKVGYFKPIFKREWAAKVLEWEQTCYLANFTREILSVIYVCTLMSNTL